MRNLALLALLGSAAFSHATASFAEGPPPANLVPEEPMMDGPDSAASRFRVNQMTTLQAVGTSFTGELAWTPFWRVPDLWNGALGVELNLGVSLQKGKPDRFFAFDTEAVICTVLFNPLVVGAGGGVQTWTKNGGTAGAFTTEAQWYFAEKPIRKLDRAIVSYSAFFAPSNLSHEIRIGVGFAL